MHISKLVFWSTLTIVFLSEISLVFPALFVRLTSLHQSNVNTLETGPLAILVVVVSVILIMLGLLYNKQKLPTAIQQSINFIIHFEVSSKISLIVLSLIIGIYIVFTVGELSINEENQWPDYVIVKNALKIWPKLDSNDVYISEQLHRYVRMFLLEMSVDVFKNVKVVPFLASISLVILTYFTTVKITQKRFSGLISSVVLLQSYTFLKYDTVAVYENFWVAFYLLSLYLVYSRWYLSALSFVLSIFSKAFSAPFIFMNLFLIYRSNLSTRKKIYTSISYVIAIIITLIIFVLGGNVYGKLININKTEFWNALSIWGNEMRFDLLIVLTIIPLIVGLYILSKNGMKQADTIMILIFGTIISGPILSIFSTFYEIQPYRLVPLCVFFAMGVGMIFSRKSIATI